jgi:hypothetical protein
MFIPSTYLAMENPCVCSKFCNNNVVYKDSSTTQNYLTAQEVSTPASPFVILAYILLLATINNVRL